MPLLEVRRLVVQVTCIATRWVPVMSGQLFLMEGRGWCIKLGWDSCIDGTQDEDSHLCNDQLMGQVRSSLGHYLKVALFLSLLSLYKVALLLRGWKSQ